MQEIVTPLEMFYRWEKEAPGQVFLRQSLGNGHWQEYTWADVADRVRRLATFIGQCLKEKGLSSGSHIGLWSSNSADWVIVDLAIMLSGNVSIPLYPGQDCNTARYILDHADVELLFLGGFDQQDKLEQVVAKGIPTVAARGFNGSSSYKMDQLIIDCEPFEGSPVPNPEDIFTIVYSSGTTGHPKGIMLPYRCPYFGASLFTQWFEAEEDHSSAERPRLFSFLPMSHLAERTIVEMTGLYNNASISFSAGLATFADELRSVQPVVFFAVPRLWAKFKAGVDAIIPVEVQSGFGEIEKQQIRQQLGLAKARVIFSGSAPIPEDIHRWYLDLGIFLREGYSMSETCALGTYWASDEEPVPGCVGTPSEGVELKLTDNNEICFRTPSLMTGYYKNPEKTAEVIVDGWYHTGDSGWIDGEGRLWITGRMGDIFKTSKGKFIHPSVLEDRFGALAELGQLLVFGHGEDQPLLLTNLSEFGRTKTKEEVMAALEQAMAAINTDLPPYERVSQVFITSDEWTIDSGLLTPTMKIKRKSVEIHYKEWVKQYLGEKAIVWE